MLAIASFSCPFILVPILLLLALYYPVDDGSFGLQESVDNLLDFHELRFKHWPVHVDSLHLGEGVVDSGEHYRLDWL